MTNLQTSRKLILGLGAAGALGALITPKIGVSLETNKIPEPPPPTSVRTVIGDPLAQRLQSVSSDFGRACMNLRTAIQNSSGSDLERALRQSANEFSQIAQKATDFSRAWVEKHPEASEYEKKLLVGHPILGKLEGKYVPTETNIALKVTSDLAQSGYVSKQLPRLVRDNSVRGMMPHLPDSFNRHKVYRPGEENEARISTSTEAACAVPTLVDYCARECEDAARKLNSMFAPIDRKELSYLIDDLRSAATALHQANGEFLPQARSSSDIALR